MGEVTLLGHVFYDVEGPDSGRLTCGCGGKDFAVVVFADMSASVECVTCGMVAACAGKVEWMEPATPRESWSVKRVDLARDFGVSCPSTGVGEG